MTANSSLLIVVIVVVEISEASHLASSFEHTILFDLPEIALVPSESDSQGF
jgi:hypothetical protein